MKKLRPYVHCFNYLIFYNLLQKGNVQVCEFLLENFDQCVFIMNYTAAPYGDNLDLKNLDVEKTLTALQITLGHDNPLLLESLLKHGANPNNYGTTRENTNSILFMAIISEKVDFVRVLLENGVEPNPQTGIVSTHLSKFGSINNLNLTTFTKKIRETANKPAAFSSKNDGIPLQAAIRTRNIDIISLLLNYGASITKKDEYNYDALGWETCEEQRLPDMEIVKLLLSHDANINSIYNNSLTPLYFSCQKGRFETVKALIELGADPNIALSNKGKRMINGAYIETEEYLTSFQKAYIKNYSDIIEYLLQQKHQPLSFKNIAMMCGFHVKAFGDLKIDEKILDYEFTGQTELIHPLFQVANRCFDEDIINKEINSCFEDGKNYFQKKNYSSALTCFYTCFLLGRNDEIRISALNRIACCHQRYGENDKAIKFFDICIYKSPESELGKYAARQIELLQPKKSVTRVFK